MQERAWLVSVCGMESIVKKSLSAPIKQLTCCISGGNGKHGWVPDCSKKTRAAKGKNIPKSKQPALDASYMRAYQADLEKERRLREARNAQKNAERAAMRAHFRRKYELAKDSKDTNHLKASGGRVVLPRELTAMVLPEAPGKDDGYNLLSAFQDLSLNLGMLSGSTQSQTATPEPAREQCRVM